MFSRAGAGLDRRLSRARGLTNKEIGALVDLSAHTIKDRLEKIAAAFDVRSRAEIVAEAFRAGLIQASSSRAPPVRGSALPPLRRRAGSTRGRRRPPKAVENSPSRL